MKGYLGACNSVEQFVNGFQLADEHPCTRDDFWLLACLQRSQIQISDDDVELIQQVQTDSQILWLQQTPYIVHAMEEQTECMPEHATDLSGPEFGVLSRLAAFGKGEMRQNEIATVMGWEKGRLSHQLTRMEKRKLIKRRPADGRGTLVAFTRLVVKSWNMLFLHARSQ